ncbi:Solute carrier family 41 member 2 [Eumeta japonica]|uniref:Solute carrier family 41 member 2 n=1 Tax=Eumeta variegata TaxID=151549 RepID=A0A4C1X7Z2_EUMVA|nr:Solute carrier family 41 member 2 [Eumeta japonica]
MRSHILTLANEKGESRDMSLNGSGELRPAPPPDPRPPRDADAEKQPLSGRKEERWWTTLMQVAVPFFIAGCGTIGAGLVLGTVRDWDVFVNVSAIFVLVPSLSGLKEKKLCSCDFKGLYTPRLRLTWVSPCMVECTMRILVLSNSQHAIDPSCRHVSRKLLKAFEELENFQQRAGLILLHTPSSDPNLVQASNHCPHTRTVDVRPSPL